MQAEVKPDVPEALLKLRASIDQIDAELLELLARRFEITAQVGQLKAAHRLESVDSVRELEKLQRLHSLAVQHGLNTEFVRSLFQHLFDEVVKNHRSYRTGGGQGH